VLLLEEKEDDSPFLFSSVGSVVVLFLLFQLKMEVPGKAPLLRDFLLPFFARRVANSSLLTKRQLKAKERCSIYLF